MVSLCKLDGFIQRKVKAVAKKIRGLNRLEASILYEKPATWRA